VTPDELLTEARRLIGHPDAATAGVWPRAAALLARQALEQAMAGLWAAQPQADGLARGTMRSQLLCLNAYVDGDVATRAAYLAAALSRACHYHPYELAPHRRRTDRLARRDRRPGTALAIACRERAHAESPALD